MKACAYLRAALIAGLVITVGAGAAGGTWGPGPQRAPHPAGHAGVFEHPLGLLAQDRQRPAAENKKGASLPQPRDSKTTGAAGAAKNPAAAKGPSAPLKPFVPSEKIPADQVVDFPFDI